MIRCALDAGISAQYILMDTWFTNEPFINRILSMGLDVIGMLKNNRQMYHYKGKLYNLDSLAAYFAKMSAPGDILGSAVVKTRYEHIPVKIVFVRNRNKKSEYIMILSTDCALPDAEIIRRYGYRWSILYEPCSYTNFSDRNTLNLGIPVVESSYKTFSRVREASLFHPRHLAIMVSRPV